MKFDPTLYLVTDSTGRTDDDFLSILEKALTGGVTLVQLREKERGGGEYLRLARLTKAVCDRYRVPLIIDDRADIAMAADARPQRRPATPFRFRLGLRRSSHARRSPKPCAACSR